MVTTAAEAGLTAGVRDRTIHRWLIAGVAVLAALVLGLGVVILVVVNANTAATQEQDYRQCMTDAGVYEASNPDDMVQMAKICHAGVYGD